MFLRRRRNQPTPFSAHKCHMYSESFPVSLVGFYENIKQYFQSGRFLFSAYENWSCFTLNIHFIWNVKYSDSQLVVSMFDTSTAVRSYSINQYTVYSYTHLFFTTYFTQKHIFADCTCSLSMIIVRVDTVKCVPVADCTCILS